MLNKSNRCADDDREIFEGIERPAETYLTPTMKAKSARRWQFRQYVSPSRRGPDPLLLLIPRMNNAVVKASEST